MVTFFLYTRSGGAKRRKSGLVLRSVFSSVLLPDAATASRKRAAGLTLDAFDRLRTVSEHDTPVDFESGETGVQA
ncbi:hypothetical protein J8I87_13850 [Paraburkholderia sp. LEh10]|uniref:hypothetical protein n=1 Tax=Paraburkholderia sp. LEh10 TaxID=2821353 RepID=UPI001AE9CCC2|nr:hypothetical protein [Paraburkholderia sp. LEh10]MBP0590776.1 hypothetical protein [Paraburkholderia sp. LEh10]